MKRSGWAGAGLVLCLLCAAALLRPKGGRVIEAARDAVENASTNSAGTYVCPVDFDVLQAENKDIYAWLYIPGTGINEPLVQREGDSYYYLSHDSAGRKDGSGALFTEAAYNQRDFSDPATVIYGMNTRRGRLFDGLQAAYSSPDGLAEFDEVLIYLPEEELHYQVFAAAPFRSCHLLHYFNFGNEKRYRAFLQVVDSVKAIDANRRKDVAVAPGDPLLILSTLRAGGSGMSYLVLAKRV